MNSKLPLIPEVVDINHVMKSILADKPRITKFNIEWDTQQAMFPSYNNEDCQIQENNQMEPESQNKVDFKEGQHHMSNVDMRINGNLGSQTHFGGFQNTNFSK